MLVWRWALLLRLICAAAGLALPWWPNHEAKYDERCTLDDRAYTGLRVMRERSIHLPSESIIESRVVVLECDLGKELFNLTFAANASLFDRELIIPDTSRAVKLVRRPQYAADDKLKYVPGTLVGGIYESNAGPQHENCSQSQNHSQGQNSRQWTPMSPLIADNWGRIDETAYVHNMTAAIVVWTSLLRSPDVVDNCYPHSADWAERIPL